VSGRLRALLWLGVLAAPLAWAAHLVAGYEVDESACENGVRTSSVEPTIVAMTVVFGALAVAGGLASLAIVRGVRRGTIDDPRGRVAFMAWSGLAASGLFVVIMVLVAASLVSLDACGR
jgi:hypothetical protein